MRPSIIFLVAAISYITVIGACTAAEEFTKHQIVPDDVIDKVPLNKVEVCPICDLCLPLHMCSKALTTTLFYIRT